TSEHLHILNLLGIKSGAIVLTKISLAEENWRGMVKDQIRETVARTFLRDAPLFEVDSLSGEGIERLREFLIATLSKFPRRPDRGCFRLAIDRVFSMHGHGAVTTGTILSGHVASGAKLSVYPEKFSARVKQLQTHGHTATELQPGMRAALNLHCDHELRRGQTLAETDSLLATSHVLAAFTPVPSAPPLKERQRVRFLITTQEVMGRIRILGSSDTCSYLSIQFDEPIVASWGDHYILRRYSPLDTLGGGRVLDPLPPRITSKNLQTQQTICESLNQESLSDALKRWITARSENGIRVTVAAQVFGISPTRLEEIVSSAITQFVRREELITSVAALSDWKLRLISHLAVLHKKQPEADGFSLGQMQQALPLLNPTLLEFALAQLLNENKIAKRGALFAEISRAGAIPDSIRKLADEIGPRLKRARFAPPSAGALAEEMKKPRNEIERALVLLDKQGVAFRLGNDIFFDKFEFESAVIKTKQLLQAGPIQVAELSKALESSRKYVVPFLEYLDTLGITERRENIRVRGRNFTS
ncbi:SelB C-terminal domain-containing protein, partial [bacterium]|nr:SelB C-terminal domain-containing protein [bacterium]